LRARCCHDIVTYDGNKARFTAIERAKDLKEFGTICPNLKDDAKKD